MVRDLHSWESLNPQERIILRVKRTETELVLRRVARCGPPAEKNQRRCPPPKETGLFLKKKKKKKGCDEKLSVQMILELRLYSSVYQNSLYHCPRQHLALGMQEADQRTDPDLRVCAQRSLFCYASSILDQFLEFRLYQLLRGFTSTVVLFFFFFLRNQHQTVKNFPAMQETTVQSLGREDPPENGMAIPSSILAWGISWTEEPGGLQSMEL